MLLLFHIIAAFSSMAFAAYTFFAPTKAKLLTAWGLAGATLASGTLLIFQNPAHLVQACVVGIIYLAVVGVAIYASQRKFAAIKVRSE